MMFTMYCISISHKSADTKLRQRLSLNPQQKSLLISEITKCCCEQCVVLCTCNRTEIYFDNENGLDNIVNALSVISETDVSLLKKHILRYADESAIHHLFSLAAGLDSMVVGEDEIYRQLKQAYTFSLDEHLVKSEFNIIFQTAFNCAKKIKTQTSLSKTSVSIASLAANKALSLKKDMINILLIGASGKTGMTVLKNLLENINVHIYVTSRKHNSLFELVSKNDKVTIIDYDKRYEYVNICDCIISATSSPHYTVSYDEVKAKLTEQKERLFIDIAVPADISNEIALEKGVTLIGIDHFKDLSEENNRRKTDSVYAAKDIICDSIDELKKAVAFKKSLNQIDRLEKINAKKLICDLKSQLDFSQLNAVLDAVNNIYNETEN